MKNLLTTVRSEKRSSKMDYSVDYNFEVYPVHRKAALLRIRLRLHIRIIV